MKSEVQLEVEAPTWRLEQGSGVPELEIEEVSVLWGFKGIGFRELMKVEVPVDSSDSRCIARLF